MPDTPPLSPTRCKEDVVASIAEQMLETFGQPLIQRDVGQRIVPSLELFRHVYQYPHRQHVRAMVRGRAGEMLWETGQALLSKNIEQTLTTACAEEDSPSIPPAVMSQYLAGAFLNLFKWWLETEMPYTPEQMDGFFQQLALSGVRQLFSSWADH